MPQLSPRVALIVDNPYRDLPGLVLVAWRLSQAGVTCYLVPLNLQSVELWSLLPDFVLLNYLRVNNQRLVRYLLDCGIHVGVLDTEGSIFSALPPSDYGTKHDTANTPSTDKTQLTYDEFSLTMAQDAKIREQVACYCTWTPDFAAYASQAGWYRKEQIVVTGTPRVDFLALQWRPAALKFSAYADGYPAPMILINGSFPLANPRFQTVAQEAEMMVSRFSYTRSYIEKLQRTQANALRGMAEIANHLARRFPDTTFIYRPHPFESDEIYQQLLKPLPNLHLVKQGTVEGWLLRSKALIHWGSSTAIDAGGAGIPAFLPSWLPFYPPLPLVENSSINSITLDVLATQIEAVLAGTYKAPAAFADNLEQAIEATFYKIDGQANRRVAAALLAALGRKGQFPHAVTPGQAIKRYVFARYTRYRSRTGKRVPAWEQSGKHFDIDDVQHIVNAIEAVAPAHSQTVNAQVALAQTGGAYRDNYRQGRAIVIAPPRNA